MDWMYQMIALNVYVSIGLLLAIVGFKAIERSRVVDQELNEQIECSGPVFWIKFIAMMALFWLPTMLFGKRLK